MIIRRRGFHFNSLIEFWQNFEWHKCVIANIDYDKILCYMICKWESMCWKIRLLYYVKVYTKDMLYWWWWWCLTIHWNQTWSIELKKTDYWHMVVRFNTSQVMVMFDMIFMSNIWTTNLLWNFYKLDFHYITAL